MQPKFKLDESETDGSYPSSETRTLHITIRENLKVAKLQEQKTDQTEVYHCEGTFKMASLFR